MYEHKYDGTLLKCTNINLSFGKTVVLRDLNAEILDVVRLDKENQGQVVSILGPSGIGKTQLFRILAGLNKPTSGEVLVTKEAIPVQAGMVGVVPQNYPLFRHRTVWGNLMRAGKLGGLSPKAAAEKATAMLERFKLLDKKDAFPKKLSGGQKQRVAIIRQLMCSDHFLLMDEPFSGLDPVMKDECCEVIQEVAALNELTTIIVVTHDIASSVQIADTIWLIGRDRDADGNIVPGAYVKETLNLIERGLAWHPEVTKMPAFATTVREIREKFDTL
jgi:polar amino acid transport system ATP-binding protein/sulfate transport system ATP-binding protein